MITKLFSFFIPIYRAFGNLRSNSTLLIFEDNIVNKIINRFKYNTAWQICDKSSHFRDSSLYFR